ncbi:dynein light chain Tctex-type 1-like [Bacillus rossius redtenbacheri]|uniref:dynein light chain Tctex-type 1-like n=1 Tax=Bacillus rossius redtenbacheri TaxID=93214 RepID=UPI002FDDFD2C
MQDNDDDDEKSMFDKEDVTGLVNEAIEMTLTDEDVYDDSKVKKWALSIEEKCLKSLGDLKKDFKYAVSCSIMQRNGAAFHAATVCSWDRAHDKSVTSHWHNDTTHVVVSVFALLI